MYGEPSTLEYGKMLAEANSAISTNGFKCFHNNTGWLGYYITTPKGNKYQLVKRSTFGNDGYFLCKYTPVCFEHGRSLGVDFKDLDECKEYLLTKENEEYGGDAVYVQEVEESEDDFDEPIQEGKQLTLREVIERIEQVFGHNLDTEIKFSEVEMNGLISYAYADDSE